MLGGGSRGDIDSLPALRFVSAAALGAAILVIKREELTQVRAPVALLLAIGAVGVLQLIPLPPDVWSKLSGREQIAYIDTLIGLSTWRPITLSPAATINAIGSLIVPLAAALLLGITRDRSTVLLAIVAIGIVSALFGILQLFGDPRSGLFLYEITNNGSAVGFFANRNHHAVFLACCVLIALFLLHHGDHGRFPWIRWAMGCAVVLLCLAIITNASRAGIISLCVALILAGLEVGFSKAYSRKDEGQSNRARLLPLALGALGVVLAAIFAVAQRSPALARILENDALEDLRAKLLPILVDMVGDFQPFGTGLGAFEYAYRMREPIELLGPAYVNEAHNDWLQFPIETGAVGLVIVAIVAAYVCARLARLVLSRGGTWEVRLGFAVLCVISLASVVDYPLRVPSMMVLASIALAMFATPSLKEKVPGNPI